eukprot:g10486.t1
MAVDALKAVPGFDFRPGISQAARQSFHQGQGLGCSKPLVAPDGAFHVVLNERMASGGVRNHFVKASLDPSLAGGWGGGGGTGSAPRVRSWCSVGTRPVRAIQGLDDACATIIYAQGGLFHFATGPREGDSMSAANPLASGGPPGAAGAAGGANEGGSASGVGGGGGGGGDGGGAAVFESLPVHSGSIVDFQVNPLSRDIVSGCEHGHVHVLNFPPDMVGVPSMKVSKYVGQPLSSARWGLGAPYVASWTSSRGLLQMLDTRSDKVFSSTQVEGQIPIHTHEHLSDVILAVGCGVGCVQLFDVRQMSSFVTVEDPVAGSVHQILPSVGGEASPSGVGDWVAFGTAGVSRYKVGGDSNGTAGAGAGGSPDDGVLARVAAGVSYAAGCRTVDLDLSAGLDSNAGLFLTPSHPGTPNLQQQQQLCGITLDFRIAVFSSPSSSSSNSGVRVNGTSPTKEARGSDVEVNAESSFRRRYPVAPAFGRKAGDGGNGDGGGGGAAGNGSGREAAGGDEGGTSSSHGSGDSTGGEVSKGGASAAGGGGKEDSSAAIAGKDASGGTQSSVS